MKNLKSRQQGFTIIEVMIVLVIAAVILLIVFLAVPALQRNSRNTQIRSDASNILGYVNDFVGNNNGSLPNSVCYDATTGDVGMSATTTCSTTTNSVGKIRGGLTLNVTIPSTTSSPAQPTAPGTLALKTGYKCNGNTLGTTSAQQSSRAASVGFVTETGSGSTNQCIES